MAERDGPELEAVRSLVDNGQIDLHAIQSSPISLTNVGVELTEDEKLYILKQLQFQDLTSLDDLPLDAIYMLEKVESLSYEESVETIKHFHEYHTEDPNFPADTYDFMTEISQSESLLAQTGFVAADEKTDLALGEKVTEKGSFSTSSEEYAGNKKLDARILASLFLYWSPYPEVRSSTTPYDPIEPCETFRAYLIGIIWISCSAIINQMFAERLPSISLTASVCQILMYPCGILAQMIFPAKKFKIWKYTIDLNPGPWSYKEQTFATLIVSVSSIPYFTQYTFYAMQMPRYYGLTWVDFGYQFLLAFACQFMGFGFAGIMRKFVVYPTKALWLTSLPILKINKALMSPEKKENIHGWTISGYNFFFICFAASFAYFWIPDYLLQALSTFNWMSWIAPTNVSLATITGSVSGLGFNPISTWDWNMIGFNLPLIYPYFSFMLQFAGTFVSAFVIMGLFYTNYKWTGYIQINQNSIVDNTGALYDVLQVVNSESLFDQAKYEAYSPPFYSAANMVVYGTFFLMYPFVFIYESFVARVAIKIGLRDMWQGIKNFRNKSRDPYDQFQDTFSLSARQFPEVPEWWFLIILIISFVFAILAAELYPAETPIWSIVFAIGLSLVFLPCVCILQSMTGFPFTLNVLLELIMGYALEGNGLALNFIKGLGTNIDVQTTNYVSTLKLGHYSRIPPRTIFRGLMIGMVICSFISLGIYNYTLTIPDMCDEENKQKFTCPSATTIYSASVIWGVIGPKRVFSGLYPIFKWCFLIGFLLALFCCAVKFYLPPKYGRYFQPTLFVGGFLNWAPYNLTYWWGGVFTATAFMYYVKRRYLTWWEKYNYLLTEGLSAGVAFSAIIIFFAVQYHDKSISWWGNNVMYEGVDGFGGVPNLDPSTAPGGYFGPRQGDYP